MIGGLSFKESYSNGKGVWVRIREINYLIEKGIITVDEAALKEYTYHDDEEYDALMRRNSLEDRLRDTFGRELDDIDRHLLEAAHRAMRGEIRE